MNYTFACLFKKAWSVSDDKIVIGKNEYLISDIVSINEKFIPESKAAANTKSIFKLKLLTEF